MGSVGAWSRVPLRSGVVEVFLEEVVFKSVFEGMGGGEHDQQ